MVVRWQSLIPELQRGSVSARVRLLSDVSDTGVNQCIEGLLARLSVPSLQLVRYRSPTLQVSGTVLNIAQRQGIMDGLHEVELTCFWVDLSEDLSTRRGSAASRDTCCNRLFWHSGAALTAESGIICAVAEVCGTD